MVSSPSNGLVDERTRVADEETPLFGEASSSTLSDDDTDREIVIIKEELSTKQLILALGSIYVGVFLGAVDSTVVATLAAPISTSFNSLSLLSWLASSYLIANAACQPISGRLTDIFSRRTGLVVSNVLFAIGNLMCGVAGSEWTMIAGRVVAGMGGGGLMAISTFVGSDLVPLRKRGVIQGVGNLVYGSGAGLGGLFGGWINDNWGWRNAFLIQVPFVVASGILVFFFVDVPAKKSEKSVLSRVDFSGVFLLVVTLLLMLLGLNSGGNIVPWTHPLVLTTLPLSVISLVAFIRWESRVKEPVIPVRLLLDRTVLTACLTNWFSCMLLFAGLFYVPIYYQLKGLSTTQAGMRLIPQTIGISMGSLIAGFVMRHTGKYKLMLMIYMIIMLLGAVLFCTITLDTAIWPSMIYLFLIGNGYGAMLVITLLATIAAVDHEHQAVITSATYAFRSTGSVLGVTIGSAVYQNILGSQLWERFGSLEGAEDEIRRIRDNFDELKHLPDGWTQGVLESYIEALRGVFLTCVGLAILAIIAASFLRQHVLHSSLDRRQSSS